MTGLKTGPSRRGLQIFAVPIVCVIISFLAYFSQWSFARSVDLAPGPLTRRQTLIFNGLVACVWYTYYKACTVDPGRYQFTDSSSPPESKPGSKPSTKPLPRWCKKCDALKPPRAHHCRHCGRCIPKMDHHCPWTGNCVSMHTFPYFFRFLLFTNAALWTLGFFILQRLSSIWSDRHLPAYLGPSLTQLISLTLLSLICSGTSIALGVLLFSTTKGWVLNSTMIEDWEVERHDAVLSRLSDTDDDSPDFWGADGHSGILASQLSRIEFPYDLGIFANMAQAMGSRNPLLWVFPLAGGPVINNSTPGKGPGWEWEENGFNDLPGMWPPPDPEKLRRAHSGWPGAAGRLRADGDGGAYGAQGESPEETKAAFAQRQLADVRRQRALLRARAERSGILAELEEVDDHIGGETYPDGDASGDGNAEADAEEDADSQCAAEGYEWVGAPAWTNSEGDTLWDYGVDEAAEHHDGGLHMIIPPGEEEEDNVPIAELIRRRRARKREEDE